MKSERFPAGRPPEGPRLRIGIDLGGTKTEGVVLDERGEILLRDRRPTPQERGYEAIVDGICSLALDLEARTGEHCRVGIGTPGSISARTGLLKNSNTVCLNGKPLDKDVAARLGRPVRIANDANCFALSEALDGAGRGYGVVFGVILGTGVGGGIVVDKKLHQGAQHIAGEWGHNLLDPAGPLCYCGKRGCVEVMISGPRLAEAYAQRSGEPGLDVPAIVARAEQGDEAAARVIDDFLARFGQALAVVINILDPDVVVLGGGLSHIGRLYTEGREQVRRSVFNDELRTPIVRNLHGASSGVRGAAALWRPGE